MSNLNFLYDKLLVLFLFDLIRIEINYVLNAASSKVTIHWQLLFSVLLDLMLTFLTVAFHQNVSYITTL